MIAEFSQLFEGFGRHTNNTINTGNASSIGEAFAADLDEFTTDWTVLFIDELDRTPLNKEFQDFVTTLVNNLSDNVQLVFSSRVLTHQPWYDMVVDGRATVLGTEHRKDDVMFTTDPVDPKPRLEVYSLGRGYAIVNGKTITNWDGALPRNLFFFFVDHPLITRDEIFQTFWPNLPVKEATNVFHVTKRKISERISMKVDAEGSYELTMYNGGFYMPSEKIIRHYDVSEFEEAVEEAITVADDEIEERLLTRAIALYKAPFLTTIDMDWVVERRNHLRQQYAKALVGVGRIAKRQGNDERALGFFIRSLREMPEREDIHREVMSIYLRRDLVDDARMQYRRLEKILDETLGIGPSRESRELFEMIDSQN